MTQERNAGTNDQSDWRSDPAKVRHHLRSLKGLVGQGLLEPSIYKKREEELLGSTATQILSREAEKEEPVSPKPETQHPLLHYWQETGVVEFRGVKRMVKGHISKMVLELLLNH